MHGYMGKILRVDLSNGRIWDEPLNEAYARAFVGGSGLAARYLADPALYPSMYPSLNSGGASGKFWPAGTPTPSARRTR